MLYSTYFGGPNPQTGLTEGGGIAVDGPGNMYITGGTNFLPPSASNPVGFPLLNAQQSCLDEVGNHGTCTLTNPTNTDAFVAKINPNAITNASLIYSTYVGGAGDDVGYGIAVDGTQNAYITGSTYSTDFIPPAIVTTSFQKCLNNTTYNASNTPPCPVISPPAQDAFIAKINNAVSGSIDLLNYATYIGGSSDDRGQAIVVDSTFGAHVTGWTASTDLPVTPNTLQLTSGGGVDAFVALILTNESGVGAGDYLTYLGGEELDQGSGIALATDGSGATYVAGVTQSGLFPTSIPPNPPPYQQHLNGTPGTTSDAFVSKLGFSSVLSLTKPSSSPSVNPAPAGVVDTFTFDITNNGPDPAGVVSFTATYPPSSVTSTTTATVTGGSGSCTVQGLTGTVSCTIQPLDVNALASVAIGVTPVIPVVNQQLTLYGTATANNSGVVAGPLAETANVVDFSVSASAPAPIDAGDTATITVTFAPTPASIQYGGYSGTITPSQTTSPSMVTATTPTFNPITVALSGSASGTTTLSIATVARPVTTGSLLRRGSFYAAWLPIGGLSLVGLGIGAGRKRRRWLAGAILGLIAGAILLQSGCGSSNSITTIPTGTLAGTYIITIVGSAGTGASHNYPVTLIVR
jgi:hypothetical protein